MTTIVLVGTIGYVGGTDDGSDGTFDDDEDVDVELHRPKPQHKHKRRGR